jgi:hypothetical protein
MARVDGDASAPRDASPRDLPANRLSLADAVLGIIPGGRGLAAEGRMRYVGCRDIGHR